MNLKGQSQALLMGYGSTQSNTFIRIHATLLEVSQLAAPSKFTIRHKAEWLLNLMFLLLLRNKFLSQLLSLHKSPLFIKSTLQSSQSMLSKPECMFKMCHKKYTRTLQEKKPAYDLADNPNSRLQVAVVAWVRLLSWAQALEASNWLCSVPVNKKWQ